jgi:hypothetical protein
MTPLVLPLYLCKPSVNKLTLLLVTPGWLADGKHELQHRMWSRSFTGTAVVARHATLATWLAFCIDVRAA